MTHPPLWFTCPTVGKGEKSWRGAVNYVEQLSRVITVEQDNAGERARAAAENEEKGGVECGEGMPCEGKSLGRNGGVLSARDILPWRSGGIKGGGEGEVEEVIVPRSGIVPVRVVGVCFTAVDEKGVVDESNGLPPSRQS